MTFGDIVVIAVIVLACGLIIHGMIRDKKRGKSCGCSGCSGCSGCTSCSGCCGNCSGQQ